MNTSSSSLDARNLAHRLTSVGHALHHRLFEHLRESDLDPRTIGILSVIDGRLDAPWVSDRIARGGKRVGALAERGWIERVDDAWVLTTEGRAVLDRVDADRAALLDDLPAHDLTRLTTALDAIADALGVDAETPAERGSRGGHGWGFGPGSRPGFGPGFGGLGFGGPGFGRRGGFDRDGFGPGPRGASLDHDARADHGHAAHQRDEHGHGTHGHGEHRRDGYGPGRLDRDAHGFGPRVFGRGMHRHSPRGDQHPMDASGERHDRGDRHGGPHRAHRAAQRAFERGFDAGFVRGREAAASE